ncbi:MAG: DNA polymerase domain-containing protein [Opitutales bacterium]
MAEASAAKPGEALVGLWVDPETSRVYQAFRDEAGNSREGTKALQPFAWAALKEKPEVAEAVASTLAGRGVLNHLLRFNTVEAWLTALFRERPAFAFEAPRPLESQALLTFEQNLFAGITVPQVRRMQLDIETRCEQTGGFPSARRKGDRVLAIGIRHHQTGETRLLKLEEDSDAAERSLLKAFNAVLADWDPDIIEGHNLFNFDLDYLKIRMKRFKVPLAWGRFGQEPTFRNSRIRIAERWLDFTRCDIPGRTVFDTYLAVQAYDVTTRDMPAYGLKDVARYFGVTPVDGGDRTYVSGDQIQEIFSTDPETFDAYLADDLRETAGVADILLPTYIAQAKVFPTTLQEICLRGTGSKVDLLFLQKYLKAGRALPEPESGSSFEGAFSRSFETGVFHHVLHYDVASLYPSLLLVIDRNPKNDDLGVFIPLLKELRTARLEYKRLAKEAESAELRQEYAARQNAFKILINSFYGYLGFPGARFGDAELAGEVTRRGRELLRDLIDGFGEAGATVLEADTDGIYVSCQEHYDQPEALLESVKARLPVGIDLEFDGRYAAMFCYKAKNYALFDGERITVRGSALKARGTEPFLKELTDHLIAHLLGVEPESPSKKLARLSADLDTGDLPIAALAKAEYLSQNPEAYRRDIENPDKKKSRRASLEVALKLDPMPRMGDQVKYFLGPRASGQTSDWQRAYPLEAHDPETCPYDPAAYRKKLKDWVERYRAFLPPDAEDALDGQGQLL